MESAYDFDTLMIKLAKTDEWTRRELNSRPLHCRCNSNNGQNGKQGENIGYFENSGKTVEVAFSLDKYGSILCYILWISPEHLAGTVVGYGLPLILSNIIAGILSLVILMACVIYGRRLRTRKDFHPETDPIYPDAKDAENKEDTVSA